jgi:preprotein translocase subunit SecA
MSAAFPDDVPIESRMVTKAVERAQSTVEQRNAEIRKNVLKYDEVMNEQRKVVYAKRNQILDAANLRDDALQALAEAVDAAIEASCTSTVPDEWDLPALLTEIGTYYPTRLGADDLADHTQSDELYDHIMGEATAYYEQRERELGDEAVRQLERMIMLNILDQHWREHLYEMDYLREGIGLRAMGQRDPLTEWQREGYDMFAQMMRSVAQDFVRYVMHAEVRRQLPAEPEIAAEALPEPAAAATAAPAPARTGGSRSTAARVTNVVYNSSEGVRSAAGARGGAPTPPGPSGAGRAARVAAPGPSRVTAAGGGKSRAQRTAEAKGATADRPQGQGQVARGEEKVGRNEPCPCGSGRKFKLCHGRTPAGSTTV